MVEGVIIALLSLLLGAGAWVILIGQRRMADARAQVEKTKGTVRAAKSEIESLRDILDEYRQMRREESQRYDERAAHYEEVIAQKHERIDELTRQNQNLAERIASLRQEGLSEGGDDYHVEDVEEDPWPPELRDFYSDLTPDAQAWAEHFINTRREAGMDWEQIMRDLDEAGSIE